MTVDILSTDNRYDVIYADPPWMYRDKLSGDKYGKHVGSPPPYPCMTNTEIETLPVGRLAKGDCVLLLWVTMPFLDEGIKVMTAWGFKYKTCAFCWVKINPKAGTPFAGMGKWTMGNAELCLLGVKGHPHRVRKDVKQVILAPRGRHSAKPPETRWRIEALFGDCARIELFARESVDGWDCWGNEV